MVDRLLFETVGSLLFGGRFGARFAAGLGIDQSMVSLIVSGKRPVTPEIERKLIGLISQEIASRRYDLVSLEKILVSMKVEATKAVAPPQYQFDTTTILNGDALSSLRGLGPGLATTCVTSPPYYGLRDYDHPDQLGHEPTVDLYIRHLVEIFREVRRVLKPEGTAWLVLGDTYATKGNTGRKRKDLMGIPWAVAAALRDDGWYLRSSVIWEKTNAMPESVLDRPTLDHEFVFLLSRSSKYYFDQEAVREPAAGGWNGSTFHRGKTGAHLKHRSQKVRPGRTDERGQTGDRLMRNRRSVWRIPTSPTSGPHLATFPRQLAEICILAASKADDLILDPFMGTGTTALAAAQLGRQCIGIEINSVYVEHALRRLAV